MKQEMTVEALPHPLSRRLGPQAKWLLSIGDPNDKVIAVVRLNAAAQVEGIKKCVIAAGGRVRASLPVQHVLGVEAPLSALNELARLNGVVSVEIDSSLQRS